MDSPPLVEMAARTFQMYCYNYKDSLSAGIIVGGWDRRHGGQVFTIADGSMHRQPFAIGGALSNCDRNLTQ